MESSGYTRLVLFYGHTMTLSFIIDQHRRNAFVTSTFRIDQLIVWLLICLFLLQVPIPIQSPYF